MRILAYEFITGGLYPLPPAATLAREAALMRDALVGELAAIPGVSVLVCADPQLPPPAGVASLAPCRGEDAWAHYARAAAGADAVWPVAPETCGVLARLVAIARGLGRLTIASAPAAIAVASSKRRTSQALAAAGVPVVPTYTDASRLPERPGAWVVKPDDGAGCDDVIRVASAAQARALLAARGAGHVAQPWLAGIAASLSLLCEAGEARVLACNRQHLALRAGRVQLAALGVNAFRPHARHERLACAIARALPGLRGYVGVDVVLSRDGPVVIEINPRLTTAYCGLGAALGINVAQAVLRAHAALPADRGTRSRPARGAPVRLELEARHA